MTYRKCNSCGWLHFGLSRYFVEEQVESFNKFFATLSKEKQLTYYGGQPSSIESYEKCFKCGNSYKDMSPGSEDDIPRGSTIQPILYEGPT